MSTATDIQADLEEVLLAAFEKRPVDPEVARRVRERSEKLREEIRNRHGTLDVAVELVREARNDE